MRGPTHVDSINHIAAFLSQPKYLARSCEFAVHRFWSATDRFALDFQPVVIILVPTWQNAEDVRHECNTLIGAHVRPHEAVYAVYGGKEQCMEVRRSCKHARLFCVLDVSDTAPGWDVHK